MTFEEALPVILKHEGGYVNDPDDPGGATNFGIIQETYDDWRIANKMQPKPVRQITLNEAKTIYQTNYWYEAKCHLIPTGLNLVVFDHAVNAGAGRARRMLQRVLGVVPDGIFGPKTLAALAEQEPRKLVFVYSQARRDFYYERVRLVPRKKKFLQGWLNRVRDCEQRAYRAIDAHFGPGEIRGASPVSRASGEPSRGRTETLDNTVRVEQDSPTLPQHERSNGNKLS